MGRRLSRRRAHFCDLARLRWGGGCRALWRWRRPLCCCCRCRCRRRCRRRRSAGLLMAQPRHVTRPECASFLGLIVRRHRARHLRLLAKVRTHVVGGSELLPICASHRYFVPGRRDGCHVSDSRATGRPQLVGHNPAVTLTPIVHLCGTELGECAQQPVAQRPVILRVGHEPCHGSRRRGSSFHKFADQARTQ